MSPPRTPTSWRAGGFRAGVGASGPPSPPRAPQAPGRVRGGGRRQRPGRRGGRPGAARPGARPAGRALPFRRRGPSSPGGGRDAGAGRGPCRLRGRPGLWRAEPKRRRAPGAQSGRAQDLCSHTSRAFRVFLTRFPTGEGSVAPTPTSFVVIGRMVAPGRGLGSSVSSRPCPGPVNRRAHARQCCAGRCCLQAENNSFFR